MLASYIVLLKYKARLSLTLTIYRIAGNFANINSRESLTNTSEKNNRDFYFS